MKIAFCDNSLKELVNFRGDIINHFLKKGNEIILIAPINIDQASTESPIRKYNTTISRSGMNPIKDVRYFIRLYIIYRKEKPDVIFHYTIKPNIYGSIAAKLLGIPSVVMITGLGYAFNHKGFKTKIARILYRFSMKFPKKIFILNQSNLETLIKHSIISPDKVILLPGGEGINLDFFR